MDCFLAHILPAFPPQLIHLFIHNDNLVSSPFLFLLGIILEASWMIEYLSSKAIWFFHCNTVLRGQVASRHSLSHGALLNFYWTPAGGGPEEACVSAGGGRREGPLQGLSGVANGGLHRWGSLQMGASADGASTDGGLRRWGLP